MRRTLLTLTLLSLTAYGQQHFSGISTSSRSGLINAGLNPAELANVETKFTINILAPSIAASSNKVGLDDFSGDNDIADLLFSTGENTNLKLDGEIVGPGLAYRYDKWTFAVSSRAFARLDLLEVNPLFGYALLNNDLPGTVTSTFITSDANQRLNGTTWGEIGFSVARNLFEDEKHKLSGGITFKLLFPGSYANFGASDFDGTVTVGNGTAFLSDTDAELNIAYSGNLGDDFTDASDYFSSLYGKLNGLAADLGVNYRLKDAAGNYGYRLNAGVSVRNLGAMSFKAANNASTNYTLNITGGNQLDLSLFEDVTSLREIEQILLKSGYLERENGETEFRVTLPTLFVAYADIRIVPDFFATVYTQQKVNKDSENDQIGNENVVSLTPRYATRRFEAFAPLSLNEISGFSAGLGFRAYGFFIGSSSVITSLTQSSDHADVFFGYGFNL